MTQFSLFGAEAAAPALDDLDGLLLAGGRWVRSAAGARLSVVVADRWRADALATAYTERGVAGVTERGVAGVTERGVAGADAAVETAVVDAVGGFAVRTAFSAQLSDHAARWTRGANQGLPAGFQLGAGGLRLWAIAAGRRDGVGYLLATAHPDDPIHQAAGAQLSRLGVAAVSLARRGGPGWRVTSARRLRRLVELLGPQPAGGECDWPVATAPFEPQAHA